ncbi:MAG: hypothetical protein SNH01_00850 [Rikenellaceae bacterium]
MAQKTIIESLESRVLDLMEDHRKLRSECRELISEREALLSQRRALKEQVAELERQLSIFQLREGFGTTAADRDQARLRVNRLMREVDKCITLLTSQPLGNQVEAGANEDGGERREVRG